MKRIFTNVIETDVLPDLRTIAGLLLDTPGVIDIWTERNGFRILAEMGVWELTYYIEDDCIVWVTREQ